MQPKKYLASLEKFGIKPGLERINYLLGHLDNPQQKFKSIHIAGTNGKGSTAAMVASILKAAGYRVGLYTSPHLVDVRERIKINGRDISPKDFARGLELVKKIIQNPRLKSGEFPTLQCGVSDMNPTYFEVLTALAFWYFANKKVDYAVVEVGLGGRWDSTNVITPLVSVITNIDYDHTHYLGNTLAKIAFEKAGIIKPGVPVVTCETKREPLRVMNRIADKNNTKLVEVGSGENGNDADLKVGIGLCGGHQKLNAACALAALRLARIKVSAQAIKRGLATVKWPGRFQVLTNHDPRSTIHEIILDGSHNPAGIRSLKVTIKEQKIKRPLVLVVGMQDYKDVELMIKELSALNGVVIVTQSSHPQAMKASKLKKKFSRYFDHVLVEKNPRQALKRAGQIKEAKTILVCGSLFLVGDVLQGLPAS